MNKKEVVRLHINYKTLEEFQKFREYGLQELSMLEDLQQNFIENDSDSPFYGIYEGDTLVARMSLYRIDGKYDRYFKPAQDYLELWKLEVLPDYRNQGYGSALVEYAKSLGHPVKTNARCRSEYFWSTLGFKPVKYNPVRDRGESPYVWLPEGVSLQD
ncbi:N-acetyltransferase [Microaerobacter geothermalis]|uniref:N-acetyltransferase n=1 Tax=Microaerobacter geothermalis TaxID=674972 RepID=UPI001F0154B2|nr:N-acetyltransferase [Microaerobacter geothermalis]MCF6093570.1 N-acetyltransferase [Microaerobacter geothermalis]